MGFLDKAKELTQSAGETLEAAAKITKEKAVAADRKSTRLNSSHQD